jgi:hypothetical protein
MKKYLIAALLFLLPLAMLAGDGIYAVSKIPAALLERANAVIRLREERVELKSLEKIIFNEHYVITVLNEKGAEYVDLVEGYDDFNTVESIEGILYDASGNKIKSLKKSDIKDVSMNSTMSLAEDGRLKAHNFYHRIYPYTVEYTVEKIKKETMFFPQWVPVPGEFVSVEKSKIDIIVASEYKFRIKTYNYNKEPVIQKSGEKTIYSWSIENFEGISREYASPSWREITPFIITAPSEFIIEDYKGTMNDWKELGLFQSTLNRNRDQLPEAVKIKVHEIIRNVITTKQKTDLLYNYLQQNTRYISIQLGIGGWRPFEANYVATKGYGDCKALSNYMYALLKEAGIVSYYTLIKAGDNAQDIIADFPARQFNHVILCVPDQKDTIWLECTSQTTPAGYMGGFTGNRHALLITEEGGKLVKTPVYGKKENVQNRKIFAVLNADAELKIKSETAYGALKQDDYHELINGLSKDKVKEYLDERLDFATYDVADFSYKEQKKAIPVIDETLLINVSNYATITGKRLFIIPNVMTRSYRKLAQDTARKYDIVLDNEYRDVDSVEIELPKGYEAESIPQPVLINTKFGKYEAIVKLDAGKLYYYRTIEHNGGRFPAKEYNELVKFYEAIYKADRNRVVLVKKEEPLKAF